MRGPWLIKQIADVCEVVNGGTPKTSVAAYWDGPHQWITPAEMGKRLSPYVDATERTLTDAGLDNSSARPLPPMSVILSSRAPIGHLVINTVPMATNQGCKGLVPRGGLDEKFLYYYLVSIREQLDAMGTGATFRELSGGRLKEVQIPLPPLPEQQRIVTILDEAFAAIATAKANTEKNLTNARALFESHLQAIFTQRGEGWVDYAVEQLVDLGVLAKPQDGNHGEIHPVKADFVESGVPFIMAADLQSGTVNTRDCRFITKKQAAGLRVGFSKDGDVLLSHKGTIGRVATLRTNDDYVMLTPQVTYYRILDAKRLSNAYLSVYFLSPTFQRSLRAIADGGSTRAYIGITRQLGLAIVVPPLGEQQAIAAKLASLSTETQRLESHYQQKLAALDTLKKSLLHQAFSGQLTATGASTRA